MKAGPDRFGFVLASDKTVEESEESCAEPVCVLCDVDWSEDESGDASPAVVNSICYVGADPGVVSW